jgi:hypothetical protein
MCSRKESVVEFFVDIIVPITILTRFEEKVFRFL